MKVVRSVSLFAPVAIRRAIYLLVFFVLVSNVLLSSALQAALVGTSNLAGSDLKLASKDIPVSNLHNY